MMKAQIKLHYRHFFQRKKFFGGLEWMNKVLLLSHQRSSWNFCFIFLYLLTYFFGCVIRFDFWDQNFIYFTFSAIRYTVNTRKLESASPIHCTCILIWAHTFHCSRDFSNWYQIDLVRIILVLHNSVLLRKQLKCGEKTRDHKRDFSIAFWEFLHTQSFWSILINLSCWTSFQESACWCNSVYKYWRYGCDG